MTDLVLNYFSRLPTFQQVEMEHHPIANTIEMLGMSPN